MTLHNIFALLFALCLPSAVITYLIARRARRAQEVTAAVAAALLPKHRAWEGSVHLLKDLRDTIVRYEAVITTPDRRLSLFDIAGAADEYVRKFEDPDHCVYLLEECLAGTAHDCPSGWITIHTAFARAAMKYHVA